MTSVVLVFLLEYLFHHCRCNGDVEKGRLSSVLCEMMLALTPATQRILKGICTSLYN